MRRRAVGNCLSPGLLWVKRAFGPSAPREPVLQSLRTKDHTWKRSSGCGPSAIFEPHAAAMTVTREGTDDGSD